MRISVDCDAFWHKFSVKEMMEVSAGTPRRADGGSTPGSRSGRFELVMTGDSEREPLQTPRPRHINLNVVLACVYSFLILTVMVGIVLWGLKTAENRRASIKTR